MYVIVRLCMLQSGLAEKWPGLYPKSMFINRGNHEAKDMNRTYGFEDEAVKKHGDQTYKVISIGSLSP